MEFEDAWFVRDVILWHNRCGILGRQFRQSGVEEMTNLSCLSLLGLSKKSIGGFKNEAQH